MQVVSTIWVSALLSMYESECHLFLACLSIADWRPAETRKVYLTKLPRIAYNLHRMQRIEISLLALEKLGFKRFGLNHLVRHHFKATMTGCTICAFRAVVSFDLGMFGVEGIN